MLEPQHAKPLLQLRNENDANLKTWLTGVDVMQTASDFFEYIDKCTRRYQQGIKMPMVVLVNGEVAGRIGLNYID